VSTTDDPSPDTGDDAPTIMNGGVNGAVPVDDAVDVEVDLDDEIELADTVAPSPAPMTGDDAATVPVAVSAPALATGDAAPTLVPGAPAVVVSPVVAAPVVAAPVVAATPAAPAQTVVGAGDDGPTILPGVKAATAEALAGLKPVSAGLKPTSSLSSSGGIAPATAAALAGLKPASSLSSSGGMAPATASPAAPPPSAPSSANGQEAVASSRPASSRPASSRPVSSRPVSSRPATSSMTAGTGGPPSLITPEQLKQAAVIGVVVFAAVAALLTVVLRPPAEPDLPLVRLPITATDCQRLKSEGKALHCEATSASLNGLKAADREERLRQTRDIARAGGFEKVVFEEKGRVWRVLLVRDAPAATTGTGPSASP
jgi:hypothetical protein